MASESLGPSVAFGSFGRRGRRFGVSFGLEFLAVWFGGEWHGVVGVLLKVFTYWSLTGRWGWLLLVFPEKIQIRLLNITLGIGSDALHPSGPPPGFALRHACKFLVLGPFKVKEG